MKKFILYVIIVFFLTGCDFLSTLGTVSMENPSTTTGTTTDTTTGTTTTPTTESKPLSDSLVDDMLADLAFGSSASMGSRALGAISVTVDQIISLKAKIKVKIQTAGLSASTDVKLLVKTILTSAQTSLTEVLTGSDTASESIRAKAVALLTKGALKAASSRIAASEKITMATDLAKAAVESLKDSGITSEAAFKEAAKATLGQLVQNLSLVTTVTDETSTAATAGLLVKATVEALKVGMSSVSSAAAGTLVVDTIKDMGTSLVESLSAAGIQPAIIQSAVLESTRLTVAAAVKIGVDDGAALSLQLSTVIKAQLTISVPTIDSQTLATSIQTEGTQAAATALAASTVTPLQALTMHQNLQAEFNAGDMAALKARFTADPNNLPAIMAYVSRNFLEALVSTEVVTFVKANTSWSNYPTSVNELLSTNYWNGFFPITSSEAKLAPPMPSETFPWAGLLTLVTSKIFPVLEEAAAQLDRTSDELRFSIRLGDLTDLANQFLAWKGVNQPVAASMLPWSADTVINFGKSEILLLTGVLRTLAAAGYYADSLDLSSVTGTNGQANTDKFKAMFETFNFTSASDGAVKREKSRALLESALAGFQKAVFLFKSRTGTVFSLTPEYLKNLSSGVDLGKSLDTGYFLLGRLVKSLQGTNVYIPSSLIVQHGPPVYYDTEASWPTQGSTSASWTLASYSYPIFNFGLNLSKLFLSVPSKSTFAEVVSLPPEMWAPWRGDGSYIVSYLKSLSGTEAYLAKITQTGGLITSIEWTDAAGASLLKASVAGSTVTVQYKGVAPFTLTLTGTAPFRTGFYAYGLESYDYSTTATLKLFGNLYFTDATGSKIYLDLSHFVGLKSKGNLYVYNNYSHRDLKGWEYDSTGSKISDYVLESGMITTTIRSYDLNGVLLTSDEKFPYPENSWNSGVIKKYTKYWSNGKIRKLTEYTQQSSYSSYASKITWYDETSGALLGSRETTTDQWTWVTKDTSGQTISQYQDNNSDTWSPQ